MGLIKVRGSISSIKLPYHSSVHYLRIKREGRKNMYIVEYFEEDECFAFAFVSQQRCYGLAQHQNAYLFILITFESSIQPKSILCSLPS